MGKEARFERVQSKLFAILTSGKYWRCIRWCDNGTTVLVTSPQLFEREVLPKEMKGLNLKDFASFVKMMKTVGFQQVFSARPSKTQKFRHPCFQINSKEVSGDEKDKDRKNTGRGRKRQMIDTGSKCFKNNFGTPQKITQRGDDFGGRTAEKRKRDTTEKMHDQLFTNAKRKKLNTVSTANQNPPKQLTSGYCQDEITAAQALLDLSTGEITTAQALLDLSAGKITAAQALLDLSAGEITAAQVLVDLSAGEITTVQALLDLSTGVVFVQNIPMNRSLDLRSVSLFSERSAKEIEVTQALLELSATQVTR